MNLKKGAEIELEIEELAFGGKGLTRIQTEQGGFVIFVVNTIPGQKVKAKVLKKRKKHAECRLLEVLEQSPLEQDVPYQKISGAPYIQLPHEKQIEFKKQASLDLFRKLGDIQNAPELFDEFIQSPLVHNYRNKMEYSFSVIRHDIDTNEEHDDFGLGFKRTGTWWKVENLDKASGLFDEEWENKLHIIREYLISTGLPAWHPPKKEGFFRHIVVRKSFANNELLINLVTSSDGLDKFNKELFIKKLIDTYRDRIAGVIHTINDDVADRAKLEHGPSDVIYGKHLIVEELLGLKFEISMQSFFQTNPSSAEKLYQKVIDYASEGRDLNGKVIMDLFCGTGTIGQLLASQLKEAQIVGVDIVPSAIENAKRNAKLNNIEGVEFFAEDVGKFLLNHPDYKGKIDTIVLDPPRAGIAPKALKRVIELGADRIVYVSCNPATQARDARDLRNAGYDLKKLSLVDQFPHTAHVESIMLFEK
ncbi:23S rRNA (uracil(1939)-C(5))-methyltransferase RlmD [Parvicella tangerina]|uniref:23S rRNA (Uracil-C(5))-methyltransferase RlmCD n=1 Tax=Parvicella tangerina TaxID=2829795 RepID=A0A916JN92_9FLAO|nr:23S rRNA (uracil(1939)-C(5))-methyltransferase RlmD [Parvicella tangerina]CAG5081705.1 23S rRNA (uracil-C(5))-methyltransferase RlmCD [Parvicella tangerina]